MYKASLDYYWFHSWIFGLAEKEAGIQDHFYANDLMVQMAEKSPLNDSSLKHLFRFSFPPFLSSHNITNKCCTDTNMAIQLFVNFQIQCARQVKYNHLGYLKHIKEFFNLVFLPKPIYFLCKYADGMDNES